MKITIDPFDTKSIENAIKQIEEYKKKIAEKEEQLVTRLAEYGKVQATGHFANAMYAGTNDVEVTTMVDGNRAYIIANGESVAFIEFGTGVKYGNGYLGNKPQGIAGIGEYGHKQGSNPKGWYYPAEKGLGNAGQLATITKKDGTQRTDLAHTYGNKPNMALYKTILELQPIVEQVAREVFNND